MRNALNRWIRPVAHTVIVASFCGTAVAAAPSLLAPLMSAKFGHRNELLLQVNQGATWKSLFADKFNVIATDDQFGPPRMQREHLGLTGTGVSLDHSYNGEGPQFLYTVNFFVNNLSAAHVCVFEPGSCLRKFISSSEDNLNLYDRCEIDPFKELANLRYDNGLEVESYVKKLRPLYTEVENKITKLDKKIAAAKTDAEKAPLRADRDSSQTELLRLANMAWLARRPIAEATVKEYANKPARDFQDGCQKINKLQMVSLLDPELYAKEHLLNQVLNLMQRQGLVFEHASQLALIAKHIEVTEGADAVLKSPEIREDRRQQIELYANYSLEVLGEKSTMNPPGFLYQVDLAQGAQFKNGATLDEELLFLMETFNRDYPGGREQFFLRHRKQNLSLAQLADIMIRKATLAENDIAKTNAWVHARHPGGH